MGGVGKYIIWVVIYLLAERANKLGGIGIITSIYGRSGHTKLQDHFIDLVAEWDGLELFYLFMGGAGILNYRIILLI